MLSVFEGVVAGGIVTDAIQVYQSPPLVNITDEVEGVARIPKARRKHNQARIPRTDVKKTMHEHETWNAKRCHEFKSCQRTRSVVTIE